MPQIDRSYVSVIDKFLQEHVKTHKKTRSENQEIQKNQRIATLRDDPNAIDISHELWQGFYE